MFKQLLDFPAAAINYVPSSLWSLSKDFFIIGNCRVLKCITL